MFRLKEQDRWKICMDHGTKDEPQTVVFLALEKLGLHNGFFTSLEAGQDVCLDSKSEVWFAPTGGGLGVFIALDI